MKMFIIRFQAFLFILAIAAITSCENPTEVTPRIKEDFLTGSQSKTWKVVQVKRKNVVVPQSTCILDDNHIFHSNRDYELEEGATKCKATDPQQYKGRWTVHASTITIFEPKKADVVLEVKSLTSSTLVANRDISGEKVEITYKAE